MGQYFIPVNRTKREYFTAWEIGGMAKLYEWCANPQAGVLAYLLRQSDESGGGDVDLDETIEFAGRWAGDLVSLVGDYDSSNLYQEAEERYHNIAKPLVAEYNRFMGLDKPRLTYEPLDE